MHATIDHEDDTETGDIHPVEEAIARQLGEHWRVIAGCSVFNPHCDLNRVNLAATIGIMFELYKHHCRPFPGQPDPFHEGTPDDIAAYIINLVKPNYTQFQLGHIPHPMAI